MTHAPHTLSTTLGAEMYTTLKRLFPLCRSLTGEGLRQTLKELSSVLPLETFEVPSGEKAFDWTVPPEWNITEAYLCDASGKRLIDFSKNNLHLVGYSIPFEGWIERKELDKHLHSLPDQPDLIPYVTSYYEQRWGFCLSHRQRQELTADRYYVKINSSLEPGSMTLGHLRIPGTSQQEILLSTYTCHPSMANNELSGPIVAAYLARELQKRQLRYTYRFVFVPETIGAITYLSRHLKELQDNVIAGYVLTCLGDNAPFSYLETRLNSLVDRLSKHVLHHEAPNHRCYSWLARGSDERQYNWPGVDLPIGSLMRTKYGEYPEYHTSGDNLDLVTGEALEGSLNMYLRCIEAFEANRTYRCTTLCEPQLGKRGLYPNLATRDAGRTVRHSVDLMAYSDGKHDLLEIANKLDIPIWTLYDIATELVSHELLEEVSL